MEHIEDLKSQINDLKDQVKSLREARTMIASILDFFRLLLVCPFDPEDVFRESMRIKMFAVMPLLGEDLGSSEGRAMADGFIELLHRERIRVVRAMVDNHGDMQTPTPNCSCWTCKDLGHQIAFAKKYPEVRSTNPVHVEADYPVVRVARGIGTNQDQEVIRTTLDCLYKFVEDNRLAPRSSNLIDILSRMGFDARMVLIPQDLRDPDDNEDSDDLGDR